VTYPSGPGMADYMVSTTYRDGSAFSSRKMLISNEGRILPAASPNGSTFLKEGSYNLELVVNSSLFQGRKIDVLIAPEILSQKNTATTTPDALTPH
jgi:hypothetical protein